jgi:hypothetical protein
VLESTAILPAAGDRPCKKSNLRKSAKSVVPKPRQKFKNDKTNPISKSLTYYNERTNPKITKQKRTQTNPISQFVWRSQSSLSAAKDHFQKQSHLKWLENLNIASKTKKWRPKTDPKKRNEPNLNRSLIFRG